MGSDVTEPRTEHQDDPWKDVTRWDVAGTYIERKRNQMASHPNGLWMRSEDVVAARAAVDARHAEAMQALKAEYDWQRDHRAKAEAELATLRQQLAAVQQERAKLKAAIEALPVTDCDGEDMIDLNDVLPLLSSPSTPEPQTVTSSGTWHHFRATPEAQVVPEKESR